MGSHFAKLGYATPVEMVETFARSEGEQLTAIAKFLIAEGLVTPARVPKQPRSGRGIPATGTVSELVADQRR